MNKKAEVNQGSHNPYFNRWFSAIQKDLRYQQRQISHNPYFNRWFSAMEQGKLLITLLMSHNPYFNRWFSAMGIRDLKKIVSVKSQSLF